MHGCKSVAADMPLAVLDWDSKEVPGMTMRRRRFDPA
jgi:hypothetical protein